MGLWRWIHNTQGSTGGATSVTITIPAVTVNNLVVVSVKFGVSTSPVSVTDNASTPNTYAQATADSSTKAYQFYGVAVKGGATTVTVSWTPTQSARVTVDEFSGGAHSNAAVFDKAASNTGTGTSSSVTLSPTSAGELIAVGIAFSSGPSGVTAGSNYALSNNGTSAATEYRLSGTTSETAPISWTGSVSWQANAGAYIPLSTPKPGQFFAMM